MVQMIETRIKASPAQIKKLMSGGAITMRPDQFHPMGEHMLMIKPNTKRRIETALRKSKGLRIQLKPDEDVMEFNEGGKVSLKKIGKTLKKTFAGDKAIKTYKEIGKEVLPIAKGIADAGVKSGSMALATYLGQPELAPIISASAQRGLDVGYSKLGKEVGLDADTPVPYLDSPESVMTASRMTAEKNIQKRLKGREREAAMAALSGDYQTAQNIAANVAIDRKLTGVEKKVAQKALAGEYSDVKQMATDYAAEKLAEATKIAPEMQVEEDPSNADEIERLFSGRGIRVSKTRGGLRIGGSSPYLTPMYKTAMKYGGALESGFQTNNGLPILPPPEPIGRIQLGSPYARINSPAMNPFIPTKIQLDNRPLMGGSFLPAGRYGNGFQPAGGY
jgi:hypothetical protein